jgi:hypothetical protein
MDKASVAANDNDAKSDKLEAELFGLALELTSEFEPWAEQDRAVYTSEVMERELERLFPVDTFLERKKLRH